MFEEQIEAVRQLRRTVIDSAAELAAVEGRYYEVRKELGNAEAALRRAVQEEIGEALPLEAER